MGGVLMADMEATSRWFTKKDSPIMILQNHMSTKTTTALASVYEYEQCSFQFREDGYFNMTKAAKHFGKHLDDFWRNDGTKEYVVALANSLGFNSRDFRTLRDSVIEARHGRYHGGTWGHPRLAVFFARWLDVKFAVWCDMVIDDLLQSRAEIQITKPEESAVLALPQDYASALRALVESLD